jgi:serine/threonine-protein kinase ATR
MQLKPDKLTNHTGVLECLLNLGHYQASITHVYGTIATYPDFTSTLAAHGISSAWRINDWKTVQTLLEKSPDTTFDVSIGKLLLYLHQNNEMSYNEELSKCRLQVMSSLGAASLESYERAYPYFLQLHMLQEMEQIRSLNKTSNTSISVPVYWKTRLQQLTPTFKIREKVMALRTVLYKQVTNKKKETERMFVDFIYFCLMLYLLQSYCVSSLVLMMNIVLVGFLYLLKHVQHINMK